MNTYVHKMDCHFLFKIKYFYIHDLEFYCTSIKHFIKTQFFLTSECAGLERVRQLDMLFLFLFWLPDWKVQRFSGYFQDKMEKLCQYLFKIKGVTNK